MSQRVDLIISCIIDTKKNGSVYPAKRDTREKARCVTELNYAKMAAVSALILPVESHSRFRVVT
ncbi:hypothetical protein BPIT_25300 [Candidatus Brocadia pituitae]|nr:hypothetical protein BPIT_25300 [Candidatus Brocadia pituitae]